MTSPANGLDCLIDLEAFGSNPGQLRARLYVPERLADKPALVVVLHGCTQNAAAYDHGSGWSRLADQEGFILLFPEQSRTNNPNLCFNWFSPADQMRDQGEPLSIYQMIAASMIRFGVDPSRIFITGLSAGGAMTSTMLAVYPELFAGGAIIAGLPYGIAHNVMQALEAMRSPPQSQGAQLGDYVRQASGHAGFWPTISIWHGTSDATVNPANADAILNQWRAVHGLADAGSDTDTVDGASRRRWRDGTGKVVIEDYRIPAMGHGTPLKVDGNDSWGASGPHMLDVGISSTHHIATFWNLVGKEGDRQPADYKPMSSGTALTLSDPVQAGPLPTRARLERITDAMPTDQPDLKTGIQKTIEGALRAAGLMR